MKSSLFSGLTRGALVGALLIVGCSEQESERPNVVLISIDTLRADRLSCYGHDRVTSPHIDALAREGVLCEDASSSSSWTLPSHWSMLTGLPVSVHGACEAQLWNTELANIDPVVPVRGRFLGEYLSEAGYRTAGFYSWIYLETKFGFGPGFDIYERLGLFGYDHPTIKERADAGKLLEDPAEQRAVGRALRIEYPELFDMGRPTAPEVVDRSLEWLRAHVEEGSDRPLFLFMHLFDVHDPYTPPPPFDELFDPDYEGSIDGQDLTSEMSPVHEGMPKRDLDHLLALYDGGIAWTDSEVGRFLDGLEELGLKENTLVIISSDHGEEFFEHGMKTHRKQLYRESVHVPLVMRWPAGLPEGVRISGPTGIVDITSTILNSVGLPVPSHLPGIDLAAIARAGGRGEGTYVTELIGFGPVSGAKDTSAGRVPGRRVGLRTPERHDLLHFRPGEDPIGEFYDLVANPLEAGAPLDLMQYPAERERVAALLDQVRLDYLERRGTAPPRTEVMGVIDAEEKAQLESLGYTSGEETDLPGADLGRLCLDGCVWPGG